MTGHDQALCDDWLPHADGTFEQGDCQCHCGPCADWRHRIRNHPALCPCTACKVQDMLRSRK